MNSRINLDGFRRLATTRTEDPGRQAWSEYLLGKLWTRMLRSYRARRARASLEALDNRTLRDIGVSRREIEQLARDGAAREKRRLQALASCRQLPNRLGAATQHRAAARPTLRSGTTVTAGAAAAPIDLGDRRVR